MYLVQLFDVDGYVTVFKSLIKQAINLTYGLICTIQNKTTDWIAYATTKSWFNKYHMHCLMIS